MSSKDPVVKELEAARIKLIIEWPIFGAIILQLELKEVDWCGTAATDGRYFYYNRDFVKRLNKSQLLFLTAHEILHCCLDHIFRCGGRNKDLWNMAIDYIVNYTLVHTVDAHGKTIGTMIENVEPIQKCCYDKDYTDEFSAEELYALLEKKAVKIQMPLDMHLDGSGSGGEDSDKKDGKDGKDPAEGGGNGDKDGQPKLSKEEQDNIRESIRSALIQAAQQQANLDPGSIPAGLQRLLNRLLEPKIDWRQMLDNVLRSAIKFDYTYTKRSRRSYSSKLILPGRNIMDKVSAIAWLDGSGSTTQEMVTDFLSECKGIMNTFRDFELTIGTFDTEVYSVMKYTPDNADEIDNYPFKGGGGTAPSACWNYMKEHEMEPHKILLFTDGWVGTDWGDEDFADTLFIIHSNPRISAPFGMTVHYEPRNQS